MNDSLQDSEKVDLEDVQKPDLNNGDDEPDEESLAQVEREEESGSRPCHPLPGVDAVPEV